MYICTLIMLQNKYVLKLVRKLCKLKSSLININYAAKMYVVLTLEWLPWLQASCGYKRFTLLLETNCVR